MRDLDVAKTLLRDGGYTCVLCCGEAVITSKERGVKPLVKWLIEKKDLRGFFAADKVVGRATAFLYVLLGVKAVYARVISAPAIDVFEEYGVFVEFDTLVDNIINRSGTGPCPFEAEVIGVTEAKAAYSLILKKLSDLQIPLD